MVPSARIRANGHKLEQRRFPLNTRKQFSAVQVSEHWHRLPRGCEVSSEISRNHMDVVLSTLLTVSPLELGRSRNPFPPQWFCEHPAHICIIILLFGNLKAARNWTYLAIGADEEWLHFDAVIDHRDSSAGADRGCIAGGGGDDGVGHTGTAQRWWERGRIGDALCLAVRRLYMADGVVGSGEGRAGIFDADDGRLLEGWRLLGWLVSAWGNREAVWNQGLWPNLKKKLDVIGHNPTYGINSAHRLKLC